MSGFEPESERFVPRISTSVVDSLVSPGGSQSTRKTGRLTTGTQKSLFRTVSGMASTALLLFDARSYHWQENGVGGRGPGLEDQALYHSLMRRGVKLRSLCDWHLFFCAELTMSAPIGSQSGASLSRRDLSSPCFYIIPILGLSNVRILQDSRPSPHI
jgi:hypothetical protein